MLDRQCLAFQPCPSFANRDFNLSLLLLRILRDGLWAAAHADVGLLLISRGFSKDGHRKLNAFPRAGFDRIIGRLLVERLKEGDEVVVAERATIGALAL
jgi:hypothetical protein